MKSHVAEFGEEVLRSDPKPLLLWWFRGGWRGRTLRSRMGDCGLVFEEEMEEAAETVAVAEGAAAAAAAAAGRALEDVKDKYCNRFSVCL